MQWYGNVPAVWNENENRPPGATIPEFHPSEVEVWDSESVFIHVTVVPTATLRSSGVKARFPSTAAPDGMVTDADGPPGAGVGDGAGEGDVEGDVVGDVELPPQAIANMKKAETTVRRSDDIRSSA